MPHKYDYLNNWMNDDNYKLLMESIALEDKSAFKGFGAAQETLRTAIQKGSEDEIKEKLDKFSGVLSEVSAHLEEKGLVGLKAFVEHTKFIVDMAAEKEEEKAPTQIDEGKKWLFMNGFPASIKSIEPLNKEPYTAAEYNSFINELGFGALWSALQGRIDAENRLNAGVSDAAEAEKLRDDLVEANKSIIEANKAIGENLTNDDKSQFAKMFDGTVILDNKVPGMLAEQNKVLKSGVFVGMLDEYDFISKAKKDVADISRNARILASELREVKGSAHKRSKYFNAMEDAVAKVAALSPNDSTYDEVITALEGLEKATKAYTDNRNRFQHNSARITQAEKLNSFASKQKKAFKNQYERTEIGISTGCNKSLDGHIADLMVSGQEKLTKEHKERRKTRLNDFKRNAKNVLGNSELKAASLFLLSDIHDGSESYKKFKESMRVFGQTTINIDDNSPEEVMGMINAAIESTDTYIKAHKGMHIGDGKRRIEYAQTANKLLKEKYDALNTAYQQLGNDRGAYSIADIETGSVHKRKLNEITLEKLDFINPADTQKMRETGEDVYNERYRNSADLKSARVFMDALKYEMSHEMDYGKYPGKIGNRVTDLEAIKKIYAIMQPYDYFVKGEEPTADEIKNWDHAKNDALEFKDFIEKKDNFDVIMKVIEINSTGNRSLKPERFLWSIHKLNDVFDVGIDISELERDYYKEQLANGKVDAANIRKVKNKAALLDTKYKQSMQLEKENAEKEEEKLEEKNAEKVEEKKVEEKKVEEKKVEEKKDEKKPFDVAENLKAAQEQLKNLKAENGGVVPEASAMKGPVSEIITSLKIMTVQKNGTLKNITRDQFAAINKSATLENPSLDVIIKNTAPTVLFDQATKGKGQDLYSNYMRAVEVSKKPVETSKKTTEFTNKIEKKKTLNQ